MFEWESDDIATSAARRFQEHGHGVLQGMYNSAGKSYLDLAVEILREAGRRRLHCPRLKHLYSKNPIPRVKCKEALQI